MKGFIDTGTIKVPCVEIEGVKFDAGTLRKFFNEVYEVGEDSIDSGENYTDNYLYFKTIPEKELEIVLLKLDVIVENPRWKEWNKNVREIGSKGSGGYYDDIRYLPHTGYPEFYRKVWDILNEILK